jgi:putative DNA primase/helicase
MSSAERFQTVTSKSGISLPWRPKWTKSRVHRQLELPTNLAGTVLHFHPRCPWRDENTGQTIRIAALIVPFRSIYTDEITAIQRIALNPDGSKIGRRMLGIAQRAAMKVDSHPGQTLAIGEGLETVLAGRQYGFAPAWALGSVGAISFFPVIDGIEQLIIFGEKGAASAEAIRICGKRWRNAGRRVRVVLSKIGSDLNDALIAERTAL